MHNALHCIGCDEVRKHVVLYLTKRAVGAVEKMFAAVPERANNPRIEVLTLAKSLGEWMP